MADVSVVVPMYNDAPTIALCLASIRAQTHPPVEIIVVDDCSADESATIAAEFGVTLLRAETNGGPGASRNLGVREAKGEYVFFLDADTTMAPDAIEQAVRLLADPAGYGAVFGVPSKVPLFEVGLVGQYRILQYHYWRKSAEGPVSGGFYALGAVRRAAFDEAGWFNPALRQTEEIDHAERLSRRHPLLLTSAVTGQLSDETRLEPILRKAYLRSRLRVPFYLDRGRAMQGMETGGRAFAAVLATFTVASVPFAVVWPWVCLLTVASLAGFVAADPGQYAFVRRERGLAFTGFFLLVHIAMNAVVVCGLIAGLAQWAASRRFRRMYVREAR